MVESITLQGVVPEVFAGTPPRHSDVWLRDLTFTKGTSYLVAADSGTGKSSLCSYIYGARTDYRGQILFDGCDIASYNPGRWSELRCHALAYLPQQLSLFPELTALDNIILKNRLTNHYDLRRITLMLERLGVADKADTPAARLSIGQQQRVAIVRALCQPFDFLLLDEPVSHLDARNNTIVASLIAEEAAERGAAVIVTSVGNHLNIANTVNLSL